MFLQDSRLAVVHAVKYTVCYIFFHFVWKKSLDSCFYEIIPKVLPPEVEILTKRVPK
jgi:hypothetical protein